MEATDIALQFIMVISLALSIYLLTSVLVKKGKLEWKLIRLLSILFFMLTIWSVYRLWNKFPNINYIDGFIVTFNFGLLLIGFLNLKGIKK